MKTYPEPLTHAERLFTAGAENLTRYIRARIEQAGSEKALSDETGVPRSTINDTLKRGGVLVLRSLAYRLAEGKK
jgi:hypothetical protein